MDRTASGTWRVRRGRRALVLSAVIALAVMGVAPTRSHAALPKVGILISMDTPSGRGIQSFVDGMRELGWVDGKTVAYIVRHAGGDPKRLPALAAELVASGVDVLYAWDPAVPALRQTTSRIPIVCPEMWDPLVQGYTASLSRPSSNVTGISWQSLESAPKRLEIAKELIPDLRRISFLYESGDPGAKLEAAALGTAAHEAGINLSMVEVRDLPEIRNALAAMKKAAVGALIVSYNPVTVTLRHEIARLAIDAGLPTISEGRRFAEAGFLVTYGTDVYAADRRAAVFVDKLLRGAKVSDLPFELSPKFDLIINLKTAKELGLAVPESIRIRSTEILE